MKSILLMKMATVMAGAVALALGSANADDKTDAAAVKHVDPAGAAKLMADGDPKPVVLDVRTPSEYSAGHLKDAVNLDFKAADFRKKLGKLDRSKAYLVHCLSGGRSTSSLRIFSELGFKSIYHLDGGFRAWEKAGQPVEK